ncbi:MAG: hypothetical protein ACT4OG_04615 [Alphaproteobacteria bacterium]
MTARKLVGWLTALALLLPDAGRLVGRQFDNGIISPEMILSADARSGMAAIATFFALVAIMLRLMDGIRWPRGMTPLYFVLASLVLSTFIGALAGNPPRYIYGDLFNMAGWLVMLALGVMIAQSDDALDAFLEGYSIIGCGIILYEIILAGWTGSALFVRYGSGLALPVMVVMATATTLHRRKRRLVPIIVLASAYAVLSQSRSAFLLLILTLAAFQWLRRWIDSAARGAGIRLAGFALIGVTAGCGLMLATLFGSGYDASSAFDVMFYRLANTIDLSSFVLSTDLWALQDSVDSSTWLRFVEAQSVLQVQGSPFFGNGLGAVFASGRQAYLSVVTSDHYIHITPVLIYFRQGWLGIIAWGWALFFLARLAWAARGAADGHARAMAIIALLILLNLLGFVMTASGSFFGLLPLFATACGAVMARLPRAHADMRPAAPWARGRKVA